MNNLFNLLSELNLFKCVYDSTLKLCEPEAVIKISADLYLMCDKLFGIFVNGEGKRIKSAETLKWPLPLKHISMYNILNLSKCHVGKNL